MNTNPPVAQRRVSVPRLRVRGGGPPRLAGPRQAGPPGRTEILLALAAFAVLCIAVLAAAPQLVEPDDYAYRASIVALTDGHPLTLSTAQVSALAAQLTHATGPHSAVLTGPGPLGGIEQWVQLPDGRWISEKDPGYPFLAPLTATSVSHTARRAHRTASRVGRPPSRPRAANRG